uniref:Uncharacterized protein n=1 Tax=Arundo donax TaxID=35708 RepID=A0A0A9EE29_ARUDO
MAVGVGVGVEAE